MSMQLSIHGAPSAKVYEFDGGVWVKLTCQRIGGEVTIHFRGPNAKEHAEKIAEAINAAHRDEVGE